MAPSAWNAIPARAMPMAPVVSQVLAIHAEELTRCSGGTTWASRAKAAGSPKPRANPAMKTTE